MTEGPTGHEARAIATRILAGRRAVLCGALGAGATALLAACGSTDDDTGGQADDDTAPGTGDTPSDAGSGDGASGDGTALAALDDIPVGGGLATAGLVLVRPDEETVVAFDAACPHQGVQLPAPEEGVITCPAHGSRFNAADGSLAGGPATTGLTEVAVTVTDGQVFGD